MIGDTCHVTTEVSGIPPPPNQRFPRSNPPLANPALASQTTRFMGAPQNATCRYCAQPGHVDLLKNPCPRRVSDGVLDASGISGAKRCLAYHRLDASQYCSKCHLPDHRWYHHFDAMEGMTPEAFSAAMAADALAMHQALSNNKYVTGLHVTHNPPLFASIDSRGVVVLAPSGTTAPSIPPRPPGAAPSPLIRLEEVAARYPELKRGEVPVLGHALYVSPEMRQAPAGFFLVPVFPSLSFHEELGLLQPFSLSTRIRSNEV